MNLEYEAIGQVKHGHLAQMTTELTTSERVEYQVEVVVVRGDVLFELEAHEESVRVGFDESVGLCAARLEAPVLRRSRAIVHFQVRPRAVVGVLLILFNLQRLQIHKHLQIKTRE